VPGTSAQSETDAALSLALRDCAGYAAAFWTVTAKSGEPVPFVANAAQLIVLDEIERQERAGLPVRLVIVKARQQGISTLMTALLQHRCQTRRGHRAISIADRLELPRLWLRRAVQWHEQTPARLRPRLEASNALELFFEDLDSRYSIGSEGGAQPGMGMTLHDSHLSEVSNWRNYRPVTSRLYPAVPKMPETLIAIESTGEMEGDDFHTEAMRAAEGDSDFRLVFLPWWLTGEYRLPATFKAADYTDEEREAVARAAEWAVNNPAQADLAGFRGLEPAHVAWRRWVLANEFGGDLDLMRSRYPGRLAEAFLSVGAQAIPVSITRHHQSTAREPIAVGRLEWAGGGGVEWVDDPRGAWSVYEPGYEYCEYAIGADVAEGRSSDPADERADRDWSCAGVLNRRTLSTVATFRARVEADAFGDELLKGARFWCDAWMSPECNSAGMATLARVREYPYLMPRDGTPDQLDDRALDRLGWRTTPQTRDQLIDEWIAACNPNPSGDYEGRVTCLCPTLAGEERTFVRTATGKREHRAGQHDDTLFAYMIALQVHRRCPHVRRHASPVTRAEIRQAVESGERLDSRFGGGVDTWALDLDDAAEADGY